MGRIAKYKGHYYIGNSTVNNTISLRTPKPQEGFEFIQYGSQEYYSRQVPKEDVEWFHEYEFEIIVDEKKEGNIFLENKDGKYVIRFASLWHYEKAISCQPMPFDRGGFDVVIDIDRPTNFYITDRDLLTDHYEKNMVDKDEFIRQYLQVEAWKNGKE